MKKHIILAAALSLVTASPALAQYGDAGVPSRDRGATQDRGPHGARGHHGGHGRHGGPGHHGRMGRHDPAQRIERMTQDLGLTPAQVEQLQRVFADGRAQREARRGQGRTPEARQAHRALMEQTRARVDAILTPAQRQRATQLREQRQAEHANRRVEHMTERLSLRPDQAQRVRQIFQQARQQHQTIGRGPEHREAHRALRERTMAQVDAVLDAQQRTRAQELRQGMRERRGHGHPGRGEGRRGPGPTR